MALILVQHPDGDLRLKLRTILEDAGHWTLGASTLSYAQERLLSHRPDIAMIAVDQNLETSGRMVDAIKKSPREQEIPVVLLWNPDDTVDGKSGHSFARADALLSVKELGADEVRECVQTLLKAPPGRTGPRFLRHGHLELDRDTRSARLGGEFATDIPEKHFDLLWFLTKRASESRELCPRDVILQRVWKNQVRDREVDVTISRLKTRVPFLAPFIESVPRKGYRLSSPSLPTKNP